MFLSWPVFQSMLDARWHREQRANSGEEYSAEFAEDEEELSDDVESSLVT